MNTLTHLLFLVSVALLTLAAGTTTHAAEDVTSVMVTYSGTYYVDAQNGDDSNSGTEAAPWRTFANVNAGTFQPGSQILLRRGRVWSGQLYPKGSGTSGNVNRIAAYGSGNAPRVNGGGSVEASVYLRNQQYWEIRDLEITNTDGSTGDQGDIFGIFVEVDQGGTDYRHVHIKNNYIHDVNGNVGGKATGGILVSVTSSGQAKIDNVLIEGNTVENVGGVGIQNKSSQQDRSLPAGTNGSFYPWEDLVIRSNYISRTGRNGIIFRYSVGAVVEYNTIAFNSRYDTGHGIYNFGTDDGIVQFNEAYGNNGPGTDRGGFDADWDAYGSIIQYNYSHDNDWFCGIMRRKNEDVTIRYNISQNEREYTIFYGFVDRELKNCRIYNNTFYVGGGTTLLGAIKETAIETTFSNNIFYYKNNTPLGSIGTGTSFSNNLYAGVSPASSDPNPVTGNPQLVNPGTGGTDIDMTNPELLKGYKLQTGSPALNAGRTIANNGGRDYFGNAIPSNPNIGAYSGAGVTSTTPTPTPTFPDPNRWYYLETKSCTSNGQPERLDSDNCTSVDVDPGSANDKQWRFELTDDGSSYYLVSRACGTRLDADNCETVDPSSNGSGDDKRWLLTLSDDGTYYLLGNKACVGKNLDVDNCSSVDISGGSQDDKRWKLVEAGSVNARQGMAVDKEVSEEVIPKEELLVYPNPAQQTLQLRVPNHLPPGQLTLHDLQGRVVLQQNLSDSQTINIAHLPPGLYTVNLQLGDMVETQKLVIGK